MTTTLTDTLDAYTSAVRATVRAQVDASACGTSMDYRRAREAEAEEETAREALDRLLSRLGGGR
jgi:hypothetical protein